MRTRTLGRWMGLAAGVVGLGGWILAVGVASDSSSFNSRSVIFFVAMILAIGAIAVSAYQQSEQSRPLWGSLLVAATLLMAFGTVLSGFTVGLLFLPAAVAALAATAFTLLGQATRTA